MDQGFLWGALGTLEWLKRRDRFLTLVCPHGPARGSGDTVRRGARRPARTHKNPMMALRGYGPHRRPRNRGRGLLEPFGALAAAARPVRTQTREEFGDPTSRQLKAVSRIGDPIWRRAVARLPWS